MPHRLLVTNASLSPNGAATAVLIEGERIAWIGPTAEADADAETLDAEGRLLTPGLIDCHTHVVHGGHRALEFEMRLEGASYEDVARAGGGIVSTVTAPRAAREAGIGRCR